ncbi:F-box/kelch-repeat protein [Quillaja saponaria]|uniref:F-box/kelch-repeat protein n=1 Tax=Quillaja saponaria TaxID=32244 RepID=A0AAD7VM01_QUISA|nr:F-box/kelch-repeat protein [Quillaja saponaria]
METIPRRSRLEKEAVKTKSKSWSDLPEDILASFFARLEVSDRKCCRFVCKNWRRVPLVSSSDHHRRLPFLFLFNWANRRRSHPQTMCKMIPPVFNEIYCYPLGQPGTWLGHTIENSLQGLEHKVSLREADVVASKKGWLLLQNETLLFLYNLLSKRVIELPKLDFVPSVARVSAAPGYPNCSVFAIGSSKGNGNDNGISIGLCHPREDGTAIWVWSYYMFESFFKDGQCQDVVYNEREGVFYCVFDGGILGSFGAIRRDWNVLVDSVKPDLKFVRGMRKLHIVQSIQGQLLLVVHHVWHRRNVQARHRFLLFRFHLSEKAWVEEDQMGNRVVILDKMSFLVERAMNEVENGRIYFHEGKHCRYTSKDTKSFTIAYEGYREDLKKAWIDFV